MITNQLLRFGSYFKVEAENKEQVKDFFSANRTIWPKKDRVIAFNTEGEYAHVVIPDGTDDQFIRLTNSSQTLRRLERLPIVQGVLNNLPYDTTSEELPSALRGKFAKKAIKLSGNRRINISAEQLVDSYLKVVKPALPYTKRLGEDIVYFLTEFHFAFTNPRKRKPEVIRALEDRKIPVPKF